MQPHLARSRARNPLVSPGRADPADQRQKVLLLTEAGEQLWASMHDPLERLYELAFEGTSTKELATVGRVLGHATQRLLITRNEGAPS